MIAWEDFASVRPDLAGAGRSLLYHHGVGLAFLATVRRDGGPRLHPMCPLIESDGMFAFIVASPKQGDLLRDGRYSMHSFPTPDNEDAFYLTGAASKVDDPATRARLSDLFVAERQAIGVRPPGDTEVLFQFMIRSCLFTRTTGHGDPSPVHTIWRSTP
ncbi:MAG: pyridoxamine 5'-phosphate oxidase family protein [Acidimicrobiales bacterium]